MKWPPKLIIKVNLISLIKIIRKIKKWRKQHLIHRDVLQEKTTD